MTVTRVPSAAAKPTPKISLKPDTKALVAKLWKEATARVDAERAAKEMAAAAEAKKAAARAAADQKILSGVKTSADFEKLTPELKRKGIVDAVWPSTPYAPVSKQPTAPERTLAKAIVKHVRDQMDLDVDPDQFATVGDPRFTVSMVHLPSGELAGGQVWVYQEGVEVFDVSPSKLASHYDTMKAALKVGAEPSDVNWSGRAVFDAKGTLLEVDPALSWSGY